MPEAKRQNDGGCGRPNKRRRGDQTSGHALTTDSVPREKANTRSSLAKNDNSRGAQTRKPTSLPKLQLRSIPPATGHEFPCFLDGDVLLILNSENTRHQLRLHSLKLRNFSPVFSSLLSKPADEKTSTKMLGPNPTELVYCLELSQDSGTGWRLQRGSLYHKETSDNYNEILQTHRKLNCTGLDGSYDRNMETAPISSIDTAPTISPPQTPAADSKGNYAVPSSAIGSSPTTVESSEAEEPALIEDSKSTLAQTHDSFQPSTPIALEGLGLTEDLMSCISTEHKGISINPTGCTAGDKTLDQSSGRLSSPPSDDYQDQEICHSGTIHPNSTTVSGITVTAATAIPQSRSDMLQTPTSGSESCGVDDTRQYMELEKNSNGQPNKDILESRGGFWSVKFDNDIPIIAVSVAEPFAKAEGKGTSTTVVPSSNTSNLEAAGRGSTETFIGLHKLQEASPTARITDMVKETSSVGVNIEPVSVKETKDDDECQFISARSRRPSLSTAPIVPKPQYRPTLHRKIDTFYSLLRIVYYRAPIISSTDMGLALFQIEDLLALATLYRALQAVIAPIGHAISRSGHSVYQGIASEPIRWLKVSIQLKHEIIFQEAVIHLVGKFSHADKFDRKLFSGVPNNVIDLVYRKVKVMDRSLSETHALLISSSIYKSEMRVRVEDEYSFETCYVVHTWREWYLHKYANAYIQSSRLDKPNVPSKLGMLYREILAGGDGYLPEGKMLNVFRSLRLCRLQDGGDQSVNLLRWDEAAEDLSLIKSYASRIVQGICRNRSQLNPAEAGFKYLTCTHIDAHEFPWVSVSRN